MIFSELKKIVSPDQHVSVSTVMDDGEYVYYGMTIDYDKPISSQESFPDQAWFNALEVRRIGSYRDILIIELLEQDAEP